MKSYWPAERKVINENSGDGGSDEGSECEGGRPQRRDQRVRVQVVRETASNGLAMSQAEAGHEDGGESDAVDDERGDADDEVCGEREEGRGADEQKGDGLEGGADGRDGSGIEVLVAEPAPDGGGQSVAAAVHDEHGAWKA